MLIIKKLFYSVVLEVWRLETLSPYLQKTCVCVYGVRDGAPEEIDYVVPFFNHIFVNCKATGCILALKSDIWWHQIY